MNNLIRIVDADEKSIHVYFDRRESSSRCTRLGHSSFDRLTASFSVEWSVDGRKSLSFRERISLIFWILKLVRSLSV